MARKPDRPKRPTIRRWTVLFDDGESVEILALHRAEARHYSRSLSAADGYGTKDHYRRVKSVRLVRQEEIPF